MAHEQDLIFKQIRVADEVLSKIGRIDLPSSNPVLLGRGYQVIMCLQQEGKQVRIS